MFLPTQVIFTFFASGSSIVENCLKYAMFVLHLIFFFFFVLDGRLLAFWNVSLMHSLNDNAKAGSQAVFWCSPGVFLILLKPACQVKAPQWTYLIRFYASEVVPSSSVSSAQGSSCVRALREGRGCKIMLRLEEKFEEGLRNRNYCMVEALTCI